MRKAVVEENKVRSRNTRSLLINRIEKVSKKVFKEHYDLITKLIGNSYGIYALYDGAELYYVGKSTELRRRVKHHLRDRHYANWTHFSLYLVRKAEHIHEIESLLVRIANPKGNRVSHKGTTTGHMLKTLKLMVKQEQKRKFEEMFGEKSKENRTISPGAKAALTRKKIKGFVRTKKALHKTYEGKDYTATLTPDGIIKIGNKTFKSPTAAAKYVTKKKSGSGWDFWYIKNKDGD
ncbi:MAG: hypothetical protein ABIH42_09125 [Planctomycetota bacterium]